MHCRFILIKQLEQAPSWMGSRLDIYGLDIELSGWVCHCTVILVDQQATVSDDSPTATISIARTAEYEMGMVTNWVSRLPSNSLPDT